jgi:pimeloyl-ACP methyl ester carboxylesterase
MVQIDTSTLPRFGPSLTLPRPRVVAEWLSTADRDQWPEPPAGEGRPVMLIPGFLAGDQSLTRLAVWMRTGGFAPARSGIRWNVDCMEPIVESVEARLERAVSEAGRPAMLVGQSRGGSIARAIAVLRPDLVDTVITLGSPLLDQLAIRARTWPSVIGVGFLGTIGVPRLFSWSCLAGDCCARSAAAALAPFPSGVRFISVYSRIDEIVRWEACLDPAAVQVEVEVSHIGMGLSRDVWLALARELSA